MYLSYKKEVLEIAPLLLKKYDITLSYALSYINLISRDLQTVAMRLVTSDQYWHIFQIGNV